MSAAAFIVCAVTVLAAASTSDEWEQPDFCLEECPPFDTISETQVVEITLSTAQGVKVAAVCRTQSKHKTRDYDVREYESIKLASTEFSANSTNFYNRSKAAYYRVRDYTQGQNDDRAQFPLTSPTFTLVTPCDTEGCEANYVKSIYLAPGFQENPPAPTDDSVYLEETEPMTVFVRSFVGWDNYMSPDAHSENVAALKDDVNDPAVYVAGSYYIAGYGPYLSPAAHSEVLLVAGSN